MVKNRVAAYRARMRERGYKEVRYWIPDLSSPEFAERIRGEAAVLNAADRRDEMAEFLADIQTEAFTDQ